MARLAKIPQRCYRAPGGLTPATSICRAYSDVRAVNSSVRPSSPPQPAFAGASGSSIVPRCWPSGANTQHPPTPVQ